VSVEQRRASSVALWWCVHDCGACMILVSLCSEEGETERRNARHASLFFTVFIRARAEEICVKSIRLDYV
jgi:hypothetical protein